MSRYVGKLYLLLGVGHWVIYLPSLCLTVVICKVEIIIEFATEFCFDKERS